MNEEMKRMNAILDRMGDDLREARPHDGFTLRVGLPDNGRFSIVGSSPMSQTILSDFADLGEERPVPLTNRVYDFHITVHPDMLKRRDDVYERAVSLILTIITTNYPRHSE